jgi:tetratricopeptide (TPR) repeat protein
MWKGRTIAVVWLSITCSLAACTKSAPPPSSPHATVVRRVASGEVPVHILSERFHYVLDDAGGYRRTMQRRYRIETLAGVEGWAETGSGWSPWYMARPEIGATVTTPEGKASRLDPSTIAEQPMYPDAPDIYSDGRVLRAPLPAIGVGSIVEEEIVTRTVRPFFEGGSSHYIQVQGPIARDRLEVVIDVPTSLPFNFEIRDAKVELHDTTQGKQRRVVLGGGPYPAIDPVEPQVPSDVASWPHVQFTTAKSWKRLARAYREVIESKLASSGLESTARGLVQPDDTKLAKANKLLDWLHGRIRYAGIEFGEASIVPRRPAETLQRGYGDCKDQSLLLVALLRAVGVNATVALLRAGYNEDVRPHLPSLGVFDHLIVVIPGDPPVWIDPTSPYARAGELPDVDQGRLALVIDDGTEQLTRTPESAVSDNRYVEVREIRLADVGAGRVVETSTMTGAIEHRMRASFDASEKELRGRLVKYVESEYSAEELVRLEHPPATELSREFRIQLEAARATKAYTSISDAYVVVDQAVLFNWLPQAVFSEELRKSDLVLRMPYRAELRYRVVPPTGFAAAPFPPTKKLPLGPAKLERRFDVEADGAITAAMVFDAGKRRWSAADVEAFKKAVHALERENPLGIALEHEGYRLIEARRTSEGLALHRKLARAHPKAAIHRLRLALALTDAGFGGAARQEARRALAVDTESSLAQRSLGLVLRADEFGRVFHPGYDRAGAIAAFRRAAALDETDVASKIELAVLLEHDAAGQRYRSPADLAQAITIYDSIDAKQLSEYEDGTYRNNVLFALLYAGKYADIERRLREMAPGDTPAVPAIITAASRGGPLAGIGEADRLGLRGDARSDALASAGETLASLGRYADGATLISAASEGSAKSVELANRARLLANVTRVDVPGLVADSPQRAVSRAFLTYVALGDPDRAKQRELFSDRAMARDEPQPATWLLGFATAMRRTKEVPLEMIVDTLARIIQTRVEGNDAEGYRV